jgi:enoyl-[acyl-carrier protein] reductase I
MIDYAEVNAPLQKPLHAEEVANAAAFLLSSLASGITGTLLFVDNGIHTMGVAMDSRTLGSEEITTAIEAAVS